VKAVRRIVGWAKVSDIQSLDTEQRVRAAGAALTAARGWITERHGVADPAALAARTEEALGAWR
jgi:5-methylthioribose kinase